MLPKNIYDRILNSGKEHYVIFTIVVYASGFFLWNKYLLTFGFFEYNFFQVRFISAGLLFWLPIIIFIFIFKGLYSFNNIRGITNSIFVILIGFWFGFLYFGFSFIPQYFGGGKPVEAHIIGTPSQIRFLQNFNIKTVYTDKISGQTEAVCILYENNEYIFLSTLSMSSEEPIELSGRVISVSRDQFIGLQTPYYGKPRSVSCDLPLQFVLQPIIKLIDFQKN